MKKTIFILSLLLLVILNTNKAYGDIIYIVNISTVNHSGNGGYGSVSDVDHVNYTADGHIISIITTISCRDNGPLNCHGCATSHVQSNAGLVGIPSSLVTNMNLLYSNAVVNSENGDSNGNISQQYQIEGYGLFVICVTWSANLENNGFNYQIVISKS